MLVQETYNGTSLIRTYSDSRMMILQNETSIKYNEAIDVQPLRYTYSETDEPIVAEEEADNVEEIQQG